MFWRKESSCEAEINIEDLPIMSICRIGRVTVFSFTDDRRDDCLRCSMEQHNLFIARFRAKIGIVKSITTRP